MQITRVELKNIKNHAEAEFNFLPGVVAICGPNGAGKTSILEAIAWALFDHLAYSRNDFIKRGAKRGQVAVSFISNKDGRAYVVTRDTAGAYFVYDPDTKTRLVEQKGQVVKWLKEHIGVDEATELPVLFRTTIGVPQGTFTFDFTKTPGERKAVFDQILKVEEYRKAADGLRDTLKHIETRINDADRRLAEAEGELKSYDETKARHNELAQRLQTVEQDFAVAQVARDEASTAVTAAETLKLQLDAQRSSAERLTVKLDVTRDTLATITEALAQARQAAAIITATQAGYQQYQAVTAQLTERESQRVTRDALRAQLAEIEHKQIEWQSRAQRLNEQLAEIAEARTALEKLANALTEQTKLETQLAALREARGERQSLERSQRNLDQDLEKMRQRYATLAKEIEKADALQTQAESLAALESQRAALEATFTQHEIAQQHCAQQKNYLAKAQKDFARLDKLWQQTQAEQTRLVPLVAEADKLAALESEQQQSTEKLAHLRAAIARDQEMVHSLATGGICPLLSEKCLNLKPGESLETRFGSGLAERRAEVESLQNALATFGQQLQSARAASAEIVQLPRLASELARLAQEKNEQQTQIEKYQAEIVAAVVLSAEELKLRQAERDTLDQQINAARQAERLFNQAAGMRGELAEIVELGKTKRAEAEHLTQRLAELSDIETQFAALEQQLQTLADPRAQAAALQQQIAREAALQKTLAENGTQTATLTAERAKLHAEAEQFATLDAQLAELNVLRQASEKDYHAYIANLKIAETLATQETDLANINAEITRIQAELQTINDAVQKLAAQYDAGAHARAQLALEQARERVTQLATQLTHTREQFAQAQARLAQLEEVHQRRQTQLAAKTRAESLRTTADFIRDILQKAAPYITESYLFAISIEANQLYRELTGRHDVTLKWAKDYEITLEEEGRERPFANLSGGEQMAAALAVRLALLKELSEINLAFFDEPTTNMDAERRGNLAQQIGRIKDFQQLFVISHDDTFEGHTDQVILLGERNEASLS